MRMRPGFLSVLLTGIALMPVNSAALVFAGQPLGQSFAGSGALAGIEGTGVASPAATDAPDSSLFANGTKAINEARWADAVKIFTTVAGQHGDHADGALYWKAYAEDKLGQTKPSSDTCSELHSSYPKSPWVDDCSALEIELRAKTGKPIEIDAGQSDDVKLLALNAMMRQDEPRALAQIQAILNGDSSEKLKKEAQFILGQHYSNETYAQIVRVSYVEGDVRVQRGEPNGKASLGEWETAVANLPLETGFSLVTGAGRAEIEFENASTIYLGENSVLTFNDLHETAGIPYTELALLSGVVSLHIHPYVNGERFILHTPTNDLVAKYPDKSYARVESFTDAVAITPLEGREMRLPGVAKDDIKPGRTWTYQQGQLWADLGAEDTVTFAAWDKWVSDRVTQRTAATNSMMEAAGLTEPIPGLAEMAGQGRFFDCAPYGTCWEPKDDADEDANANRQPSRKQQSQQPKFELAAYHPYAQSAQSSAQAGTARQPEEADFAYRFPCTPGAIRFRVVKDPATGNSTVVDSRIIQSEPYDWAVCHAGSWIRHKRHYVWVSGGKRHHIDPVRWVKSEHKVGFVPLHPYDVKGQPAVNARHEVFTVNGKNGKNEIIIQPVKFEASLPIEYLKEAPKEFRNPPMRPLTPVETPHMEAHSFTHAPTHGPGIKGTEIARASVPIRFEPKSLSFTMPKQETHGGHSTTVFAPITNHSGSLQARGGSYSGGSGFHGSSSASVSSSHGGGGGSTSGGGGGGGSHGGGGSVSSSSSSSSGSSSSGGGASSGGGSHH